MKSNFKYNKKQEFKIFMNNLIKNKNLNYEMNTDFVLEMVEKAQDDLILLFNENQINEIKKWIRNYNILHIICDNDDEIFFEDI